MSGNPFANFYAMQNPLAAAPTFEVYNWTGTLGPSNAPIRTYTIMGGGPWTAFSAQTRPDHVFDPLAGREVYKQMQAIFYDPTLVTVLATDRIQFDGKMYDQISTPSDQDNVGLIQRIDLREVVE